MAGIVVIFLAISVFVLRRIEQGDFWLMRAYVIALGVVLYGGPVLYIVARTRKARSQVAEIPAPPSGVPADALPVSVRLGESSDSRGRSRGWLSVDGPWLVFQGERFDFRVAKRDMTNPPVATKNMLSRRYRLRLPKGLSAVSLWIIPGSRVGKAWVRVPERLTAFEPALEEWLQQPEPSEPSVYPPLRSGFPLINPWPFLLQCVPAAVVAGLFGAWLPSLFAPYLSHLTPLKGAFGFAAFVVLFAFVAVSGALTGRKFDREVDRQKSQ